MSMRESPEMSEVDARIWRVLESRQVQPPTTPWGIRNVLWVAGMTVIDCWQPIETALPHIEPAATAASYYQFRCLLQDNRGHVTSGYGYWANPPRGSTKVLRWNNGSRQFFPKYWMPLPAARSEP